MVSACAAAELELASGRGCWCGTCAWNAGTRRACSKTGLSAAAFQRLLDEAAERVGKGPTGIT